MTEGEFDPWVYDYTSDEGCVGCGDDTLLDEDYVCLDCRNEEKLERDARLIVARTMHLPPSRVPEQLTGTKAEQLRVIRVCRDLRKRAA